MKWPPDKSRPAYSPHGARYAIQSVGAETVTVVHEERGFTTTVGRVEFTENWNQKGPDMKPNETWDWDGHGKLMAGDAHIATAVAGAIGDRGGTMRTAPDYEAFALAVFRALEAGETIRPHTGFHEDARAALKKAGAL